MDGFPQTSEAQSLRWSGQTHRGKVRPQNEDAFMGLWFDSKEAHHLGKVGDGLLGRVDYVFAVSDGMGGAMAGEFASRIVVEKVTRLLPRSFKQNALGLDAGTDDVLTELFDQIHDALMRLGDSYAECTGMGATLSLTWFSPGWMHWAHVGDSRLYYFPARSGGFRQLSHDDTYVGWLLRNGKINEREARNHPRRNVLQKALGAGHQFVEPQIGSVAYEPGDLFLLCTDGLVDSFFDARLLDLLRHPESANAAFNPAARLVDAALEGPSRDNITALVIEVLPA
jgi:serine/threonine protein phosphatase PrpC